MFHVEHTPIQVTPTLFRSTRNQCVRAGLETDHGAFPHKLSDGHALPIHPGLSARTVPPQTQSVYAFVDVTQLGEDRQARRSPL